MGKVSNFLERRRPSQERLRGIPLVLGLAYVMVGFGAPSLCYAGTKDTAVIFPVAVTNMTALPDAAIAIVTGTGMRAPAISGNSGQPTSIILWDEMRPTIQQPLTNNSTSTITVNGILQ
ncbi:MAG TPA: hypothetical protein PLD79_05950 [Halothiobacillus sp.]|nr:hypothetical protein [Halothiobacillus sp.]